MLYVTLYRSLCYLEQCVQPHNLMADLGTVCLLWEAADLTGKEGGEKFLSLTNWSDVLVKELK